jgi:hypothetical protein
MSKILEEGQLKFEFDTGWSPIEKWDEHPAYKNGIHQSPGAKAVDFIGMRDSNLYLVEVKDYRVHSREKEAQHLEEFEQKVVGTVAGLVGAHRCEQHPDICKPLVEALANPGRRMVVVYWLELPGDEKLEDVRRQQWRKSKSSVRQQEGKGRLRWLQARFLQLNKAEQDQRGLLPGLKVSHLPGSGQPPKTSPQTGSP